MAAMHEQQMRQTSVADLGKISWKDCSRAHCTGVPKRCRLPDEAPVKSQDCSSSARQSQTRSLFTALFSADKAKAKCRARKYGTTGAVRPALVLT
eukprot:6195728-Pleurochrysis_carterae.AAC.3